MYILHIKWEQNVENVPAVSFNDCLSTGLMRSLSLASGMFLFNVTQEVY